MTDREIIEKIENHLWIEFKNEEKLVEHGYTSEKYLQSYRNKWSVVFNILELMKGNESNLDYIFEGEDKK